MKQKLFTLLTLALFFCSGAWAAEPTVVLSGQTDLDASGEGNTVTSKGITITITNTNSKTISWDGNNSGLKFSGKGVEFTIEATNSSWRISNISILSTTNNDRFATTATYTYSRSSKTHNLAITTPAQSVDLVTTSGGITMTQITITYSLACTSVAAPTGLSCTAHTKNSLTFGWTAAEHASSYDVAIYDDAGCTSEVASDNVTTTSKTFTGLGASKTYYCKVQSKGDGTTYCTEGNVTAAESGTTDDKDYVVTAASNNALWGTATAAAGSLDEDETTEVTATPESGYKFVSWAVSGEGASLSSTTDNPTTLTMGTANATVTATFRALYTYTITYDKGANGTGSIDAGEKTEDVAFTLSSSKFTRAGYVQTGWSLTDGGEKAYDLGGSYTTNAAQTFYPFWTELDAQTSISGYTKWNWADLVGKYTGNANSGNDLKMADDGKGDSKNVEVLMSNIPKYGRYVINYPASFDAQSLLFNGEYIVRKQSDDYVAGATYIKFTTTVPGIVTVTYADNGTNNRFLRITDTEGSYDGDASTSTTDYKTFSHSVAAGEVKLAGYKTEETFIRFKTIIFQPTVTVSVGGKGYATYCNSDYALDFTDCTIQPYVIASADGSTLTLTNKKKIAKNEPVLLYSTTNSDSQSVPAIADGDATAEATNKLVKGDNLAHTWVSGTAEHYVLATATVDPGFYRANNNTVASTKAYLDLTGLSGAHSFTLDLGDGDVTGINTVQGSELKVNGYYDLQGRKIAQPTKGLYIMNGKKVIVK